MILQENSQKIAFARIISDLIEADFIIEASEIRRLEEIKSKFGITKYIFKESRKHTFEWAIRILCQLSECQKAEVKETLCSLALSDGACVPFEALQIISFCSALDGKGEVFSIPSANKYVDNLKVIYIENEDKTPESKYIDLHYREICNEFLLAGFDFVHIPQIAEDYRKMDSEYLEKAISYMIPSLGEDKISSIKNELCTMTTSRFCRDILYGKMGLRVLGTKPAFLIKTGESFVIDGSEDDARTPYSNYLKIEFETDVVKQVISLMDHYRSLVNTTSNIAIHPLNHKFVYYGFHRSLFDLIAFCQKQGEYEILIDSNGSKGKKLLFYSGEDVIYPDLDPQSTSLYLFMIQQSIFGNGLDWRENICAEDKDKQLLRYNKIYYAFGNGRNKNKVKDPPMINKIIKKLENLRSAIINIDSFIPQHKKGDNLSLFYIPIQQCRIHVKEGKSVLLMTESEFWRQL